MFGYREPVRKVFGLVVLLGVLGATVAGCTGSTGSRPGSETAQAGTPRQKTALWVEQGDQTKPFENGTALVIGDVTIEIFVTPYPPLREGSIDLYVTDSATRRPVEDGAVRIGFDMSMPHGNIKAEALPTGGGHFLVPYKLVMPGEWRAEIVVAHGGDQASLAVIFKID